MNDFTAIGDVVNTAARLQAEAGPGEIVLSQLVYDRVKERYPDAPEGLLSLRGKTEEVPTRGLSIGGPAQ